MLAAFLRDRRTWHRVRLYTPGCTLPELSGDDAIRCGHAKLVTSGLLLATPKGFLSAIRLGNRDLVMELVAEGRFSPQTADSSLWTGLHVAAARRDVHMYSLLESLGGDPSAVALGGCTPRDLWEEAAETELGRLTTHCTRDMASAKPNERSEIRALVTVNSWLQRSNFRDSAGADRFARQLLIMSCLQNLHSVARLLLEGGVDANGFETGPSPLFATPTLPICEMLIEWGTNIEHADASGRTAIFKACASRSRRHVLSFLEWGARLDVVSDDGRHAWDDLPIDADSEAPVDAPLHEALQLAAVDRNAGMTRIQRLVLEEDLASPDAELVRRALESGCDVNSRLSQGQCPIHDAAAHPTAAPCSSSWRRERT